MPDNKILIIVPAFNEAGNVQRVVGEIVQSGLSADIIVIDDGSVDNTVLEARKTAATVLSLPFNLGIGGAVQTGLLYARDHGYEIAVQVDGDGQHDPEFIPELLAPIKDGRTDMAIGSRFLPPFLGYQSSFVRRIGINFFAWLLSALTGYKIADATSGFRAFNHRAIATFSENYPQDYPEPESIAIARLAGLRVLEVPVRMRERIVGNSSIRYLRTLYYMIKVTFAILLDMIRK